MQEGSATDRVGFNYSTDESKVTELAGVKLSDYYRDLRLMVQAQRRCAQVVERELGVDHQGLSLSEGHVNGPEYLGARIHRPDDEEPMIAEPRFKDGGEVRAFHLPDPPDHPVARRHLARAREFYELTGLKSTVDWEGAVSSATLAMGAELFYYLVSDEPETCDRFLSTAVEGVIAWRRWHDAEMGIEPPTSIGASDDMSSFLSPPLWRRFALPTLLRWYEAFRPARERHMHICGETTHLLDQIKSLGLASFDLGEMVDLAKARKVLEGTVLSRIWDFRLVRDGTVEEIRAYSRAQLAIGGPGGDFTVHVEGWRGVPLSKVRVVKETVDEWNLQQGGLGHGDITDRL